MAREAPQAQGAAAAAVDADRHRINRETGRIAWVELQRHFASGRLVAVDVTLDLVDVARTLAADDKTALERWLSEEKVHPVTDDQARDWHARDAWLWAVVTKPWVLVQDRPDPAAD